MSPEELKEAAIRNTAEIMAATDEVIEKYRKLSETPGAYGEELGLTERLLIAQVLSQQAFLLGIQQGQEANKPMTAGDIEKRAGEVAKKVAANERIGRGLPLPPGHIVGYGACEIRIRKIENGFIIAYPTPDFGTAEVSTGDHLKDLQDGLEKAMGSLKETDRKMREPVPGVGEGYQEDPPVEL